MARRWPEASRWGVITIQRVRVRWSAAARGAPQANARRGLYRPAQLPSPMPVGDVVIHEVFADEAARYVHREDVVSSDLERARDLGLSLSVKDSGLVVDRLPGGFAYPREYGPTRLFTLGPGQIGRYRANFRFTFTTCPCNPSWYYEEWLVLIANGEVRTDGFISREPDHDADQRVHLYGGSRRSRA
ncbi:hypothetical protein Are01nite_23250 [Actinoplanes regularis]|nr:hypothetical protein Are01nite_23250 [Actinoplanes regularis]